MHYKNMTRLTIEGMMKGIKKLGAKQTDTIQYKYLHHNTLQLIANVTIHSFII